MLAAAREEHSELSEDVSIKDIDLVDTEIFEDCDPVVCPWVQAESKLVKAGSAVKLVRFALDEEPGGASTYIAQVEIVDLHTRSVVSVPLGRTILLGRAQPCGRRTICVLSYVNAAGDVGVGYVKISLEPDHVELVLVDGRRALRDIMVYHTEGVMVVSGGELLYSADNATATICDGRRCRDFAFSSGRVVMAYWELSGDLYLVETEIGDPVGDTRILFQDGGVVREVSLGRRLGDARLVRSQGDTLVISHDLVAAVIPSGILPLVRTSSTECTRLFYSEARPDGFCQQRGTPAMRVMSADLSSVEDRAVSFVGLLPDAYVRHETSLLAVRSRERGRLALVLRAIVPEQDATTSTDTEVAVVGDAIGSKVSSSPRVQFYRGMVLLDVGARTYLVPLEQTPDDLAKPAPSRGTVW